MSIAAPQAKAEALEVLAALEWEEAALFARRAVALVSAADLWTGQDDPSAPYLALDIALSCQIAQVTATTRLRRARHLVDLLPLTLTGLRDGQLTVGQGLAVMEETEGLSEQVCREVELRMLPRVVGMTPGDTRREVKRAIVAVDALAAEARRQERRRERKVWTSPRPDGRGFVGAEQSAEDAGAFWRALTELAKGTFAAGDDRSLDQQRADVFSHLPQFALEHLDGAGPGWQEFLTEQGVAGVRPCARGCAPRRRRRDSRVQAVILVPVETALDLSDNPAELVGYGPVSGAHARELLATADLRKACTNRWTGRMVALDRPLARPAPPPGEPEVALDLTLLELVLRPSRLQDEPEPQHDPGPDLTDLVRLRDTRCTGPGCARPARDCDLEHADPYPAGQTSPNNVGPVSRRCHNAKTHGGWTLTPHPDGSVTWSSPLGHSWTQPPRHRPADHTGLQKPRLVWPLALVELDGEPSHLAP